jgi:hypothetical protein
MRVASKIEFLEPWCEFIPGQGDAFLQELKRELAPGHLLEGLSPFGHSGAEDDALFETGAERVFQVHLTLCRHAEQAPLPLTRVYSNAD